VRIDEVVSYKVREHADNCTIGIGATLGQQHLEPLFELLRERREESHSKIGFCSEIVVIDFDGIEAATASYMKALVLPLLVGDTGAIRETVISPEDPRNGGFNIYPVVAGLSDDVREELDGVLRLRGVPCLEVLTWSSSDISSARLLGALDAILKNTYAMLLREQEATASDLHAKYVGERITTTGWNNRLADLYRLRLVTRHKMGRQWMYRPIVSEVNYG